MLLPISSSGHARIFCSFVSLRDEGRDKFMQEEELAVLELHDFYIYYS